jgi:hypothetical protein
MRWLAVLLVALGPLPASAAKWEDATMATIGATAEWSNKVEIADIDGDGRPDILFANGAGYNKPGAPEQNRAFINQGAGMPFMDASDAVFGQEPDFTRAIKVRDLDGDGNVDLLVANTFETQSRLYLGDGQGGFSEATDQLPQGPASFGDAELGDVDGDGDLDAVLADWGPGQANNSAGRTRLWINDGMGGFTDATDAQMPNIEVAWSWELELADVDNDLDLDILVSCKSCAGSYMFVNDGAGVFTDASDKLPQFANNYEFEAIDLTGDGFLDLITINDGPNFTDHIFVGDGMGGFTDATAELWPVDANPPGDDNMVAFLDVESDGDADFVVCGLFGNPDRLLINDGTGHLTLDPLAFTPATSQGSLGIAVADLDADGKIDVVMSEGEAPQNADRVFLGVDVAADTAPPKISLLTVQGDSVFARIHDNKSPTAPHDFQKVVIVRDGIEAPMQWYGEALWRGGIQAPTSAELCATDAAGNETCVPIGGGGETTGGETTGDDETTGDATTATPTTGDATTATPTTGGETGEPGGTSGGTTSDDTTDSATAGVNPEAPEGCGCRNGQGPGAMFGLALLGLVRRRNKPEGRR